MFQGIKSTSLEVVLMLDRMNKARRNYEQAASDVARQEADALFTECYDWLVKHEVPFYYDVKSRLWMLITEHIQF